MNATIISTGAGGLAKSEIALLGSDACWCAECDMQWHVIIAIPRAWAQADTDMWQWRAPGDGGHGTHGIMQHWPPDSDQKIHSMEILWDI